jgi:hypothetical protein
MIKGNTKKYEIWTGNFSLGQGYHGGESPEKVGEEEAISFKVACIKHSLKKRLEFIDTLEGRNNEEDILEVGLRFYLDLETLSQPWIGRYYESKEQAMTSFFKK